MTLHQIDFGYNLPEWGTLEMEMDEALGYSEKEAIALAEIKNVYPDIIDIEVEKVRIV